LDKLNELETLGDITIYESVLVRKNARGESEILREDSTEGWRMLNGMSLGGLLGILGGPIGFVVGLYSGAIVGGFAELDYYDFAEDFLVKVKDKMPNGTVSIVAEIEEESNVFVDSYLKPFGAVINRSDINFEFDKYENEQIEEMDEAIADERAALKKAIGNDRKKIQKKMDELKDKRRKVIADLAAKGKKVKDNISIEIDEQKKERIKRRIERHEEKLNVLNKQLRELQHEHE